MNKLAENLKVLRKRTKLKQWELSEGIYVSRVAVSMYETKRSEPTLDTTLRIAKFFNISVDELLNEEL